MKIKEKITKENYDKIYIRDLLLRCIIGINDEERINKQDIIINVIIYTDLNKASISDNINDSVDYKKIKKDIISIVENSSFFLIEKLANKIAEVCLTDNKVKIVDVTVDKPGALRFTRSVAVQITRYNKR